MFRYRLRTLLIVLAVGPPLLAWVWMGLPWISQVLAAIMVLVWFATGLLCVSFLAGLVIHAAVTACAVALRWSMASRLSNLPAE